MAPVLYTVARSLVCVSYVTAACEIQKECDVFLDMIKDGGEAFIGSRQLVGSDSRVVNVFMGSLFLVIGLVYTVAIPVFAVILPLGVFALLNPIESVALQPGYLGILDIVSPIWFPFPQVTLCMGAIGVAALCVHLFSKYYLRTAEEDRMLASSFEGGVFKAMSWGALVAVLSAVNKPLGLAINIGLQAQPYIARYRITQQKKQEIRPLIQQKEQHYIQHLQNGLHREEQLNQALLAALPAQRLDLYNQYLTEKNQLEGVFNAEKQAFDQQIDQAFQNLPLKHKRELDCFKLNEEGQYLQEQLNLNNQIVVLLFQNSQLLQEVDLLPAGNPQPPQEPLIEEGATFLREYFLAEGRIAEESCELMSYMDPFIFPFVFTRTAYLYVFGEKREAAVPFFLKVETRQQIMDLRQKYPAHAGEALTEIMKDHRLFEAAENTPVLLDLKKAGAGETSVQLFSTLCWGKAISA